MARFTENFTLTDIFNNKKLGDRLPLINYKEKERPDGKMSYRTYGKTVNRLVFDTSIKAGRPFYKDYKPIRAGDLLVLTGELVGDHDDATNAVYQALLGVKSVLIFTANNADIIRDALKEGEKNKRKFGINTKLKLRAQSMAEIEGMSKRQIMALMNDIMENILYGDNFPQTQKKWKVEEIGVKSPFNYNERKERWKRKVGE